MTWFEQYKTLQNGGHNTVFGNNKVYDYNQTMQVIRKNHKSYLNLRENR